MPAPQVLRSYVDDSLAGPVPAVVLRWPGLAGADAARYWDLPEGVNVVGPAPRLFGITIHRHGPDTYAVRLLWDQSTFGWQALSRSQLLGSSLVALLAALGSDLWYLLDQPIGAASSPPGRAA
jgi:hypothetical protein